MSIYRCEGCSQYRDRDEHGCNFHPTDDSMTICDSCFDSAFDHETHMKNRDEEIKEELIKEYEGLPECTDEEFYAWLEKKNEKARFFIVHVDLESTEAWYVKVLKQRTKQEMLEAENKKQIQLVVSQKEKKNESK